MACSEASTRSRRFCISTLRHTASAKTTMPARIVSVKATAPAAHGTHRRWIHDSCSAVAAESAPVAGSGAR